MSSLTPEQRLDKNGYLVTRHVRSDTSKTYSSSLSNAFPVLGFSSTSDGYGDDEEDEDNEDETDEDTERWEEVGLDRAEWEEAGWSPEEASLWDGAGISSGAEANLWQAEQFDPSEVEAWIDSGFDAEAASQWRSNDFGPSEAERWDARFAPEAAFAWSQVINDAEKAYHWSYEMGEDEPSENTSFFIDKDITVEEGKSLVAVADSLAGGQGYGGETAYVTVQDIYATISRGELSNASSYMQHFAFSHWGTLSDNKVDEYGVSRVRAFVDILKEMDEVGAEDAATAAHTDTLYLDDAMSWSVGIKHNSGYKDQMIIESFISEGKSPSEVSNWLQHPVPLRPQSSKDALRFEQYMEDIKKSSVLFDQAPAYQVLCQTAKTLGPQKFDDAVEKYGVVKVMEAATSGLTTEAQLDHYLNPSLPSSLSEGAL